MTNTLFLFDGQPYKGFSRLLTQYELTLFEDLNDINSYCFDMYSYGIE